VRHRPELDPHLMALMARANRAHAAGQPEEALTVNEEILRRLDDIYGPDEMIEVALTAHRGRVADLVDLGRLDEALAAIDEILRRYRDSDDVDAREAVAAALWNRTALRQEREDRDDEAAIAELQELVGYIRAVPEPERGVSLRRILVQALCELANDFRWLGHHRAAIGATEPLVGDRSFDDDGEETGPRIALALRGRGIAFEALEQPGDAAEAFRLVDERFGDAAAKEPDDVDGGLREQVLRALVDQGRCLDALDRDADEEELSVCTRTLEIAGGSTVPWMRREVAKVMANASSACLNLGRLEDGLAVSDAVLRRLTAEIPRLGGTAAGDTAEGSADAEGGAGDGDDEDTGPGSICDSLDRAVANKIAILHLLGRHGDEIAAWDQLARRHGSWAAVQFAEQLTECSTDRARVLAEAGQPDRALALLDGLASRVGDPCPWETELATRIARAYLAAGDAFARAGHPEEAVLALAQVPRRLTRPWARGRECSPADAESHTVEEPEDEEGDRSRREIDRLVRSAETRMLALQMVPLFGP
jgi:tetratricopeptide (TPR) repeat protein